MTKLAVFGTTLILVIFFLGQDLFPFNENMFEFHDETQIARIQQFTLNLQHLKLPPRLAPDFSFGMGYPVFNYYAPFTYWVTGLFDLVGFSVVQSLKLSFLLALVTAFCSSYLFLKQFFRFLPAIAGAVMYVSSLYFAIDIFIRGNLAETWFMSLLPLALYILKETSDNPGRKNLVLASLILAATFSAHNLLSLLAIPLIIIYILLHKNKKLNIIAVVLSFGINAYYFLPLILETSLTNATQIAQITEYQKHFLCPVQLWDSVWGYGGSIEGCADGIPFKLGKLQILFFLAGLTAFIISNIKQKEKNWLTSMLFALLTIKSLFLTTFYSRFIWDIFAFVMSIIQFPWRFISFSIVGIAFFTGYFFQKILRFPGVNIFIVLVGIFVLYNHSKYFTKPQISQSAFEEKYLSEEFIKQDAAYKIPEYLPKNADYKEWVNFGDSIKKGLVSPPAGIAEATQNTQIVRDDPYHKEIKVTNINELALNLHYFPFWQIKVNGQRYIPVNSDLLARPTIIVPTSPSTITVRYVQTPVEMLGNLITTISLLGSLLLLHKHVWNKLSKINS